jgi:PAS domain S-box-containing protein
MDALATAEWLKNIDSGLVRIARILANQDGDTTAAFREITQVLCHTLEASRVSLWLFNHDCTRLFCGDLFDSATASHHQGPELCDASCSDIVRVLGKQEATASTEAGGLYLLSSFVSKDFEKPASVLHGTIRMTGHIAGLLLVEQVGQPRDWRQDEIMLVRASGNFAPTLLQAQERIRIEEELKRNLSLLKGTLESTDEGIVVVGLDRTISLTNRRFREMVGIAQADERIFEKTTVASQLLGLVKYPEQVKIAADLLYSNPERQEVLQVEFKDGRIFELFSLPQRIENKIVGRIFSYRDITERIRNEQARAKLEIQLRHAQKMEAIGTLAGGIAHDFNNILSSISCNIELARGDIAPDHPAQESLSDMTIATRRAADLVKQILTFSRQQVPESKLIHIEPVLHEALKLIRASIPATIDIEVETQPELPSILADATQIHQVMMNLCTNAWHAIGNRAGIIKIQAQIVAVDGALANYHQDLHPGDYLRLSIGDTGCGMDAATIERIFEPFFTTKTPDKGTGLGLSVVHGIVRGHGGAIAVTSEPGAGTTFHLYFPALRQTATTDTTLNLVLHQGHGEAVLMVDDEPSLVETGRRTLERLGYQVTALPSANEAIALFNLKPASFDVAIFDLTMPAMTGIDLAARLHAIRPGLPVILVTGNASGVSQQQLVSSGISEVVHKPLSAQLLGDALHRILSNTATNWRIKSLR